MAKAKKKRAEKYDPKQEIWSKFEDVIGVSFNYTSTNYSKSKAKDKKEIAFR